MAAAITVLLIVVSAGCSSSGSTSSAGTTPVRLADVQLAVKAIEKALGGPQSYTEINVDVQQVNLFVARNDGTELAYLYKDGKLSAPDAPQAQQAGAVVFPLTNVRLDKVAGFQRMIGKQMTGAVIARVVLISNPTDGFVWHVYVSGAKQSKFIVGIAIDGTTVSGILSD